MLALMFLIKRMRDTFHTKVPMERACLMHDEQQNHCFNVMLSPCRKPNLLLHALQPMSLPMLVISVPDPQHYLSFLEIVLIIICMTNDILIRNWAGRKSVVNFFNARIGSCM